MAFEVERTPAIPDLLYATAVSPPNRSGDRGTNYEPGLPESAPKRTCRWNTWTIPETEKQGRKPRQARLTTGAQAPTLAAGYFCQPDGRHHAADRQRHAHPTWAGLRSPKPLRQHQIEHNIRVLLSTRKVGQGPPTPEAGRSYLP
jgi:hypothetical protein